MTPPSATLTVEQIDRIFDALENKSTDYSSEDVMKLRALAKSAVSEGAVPVSNGKLWLWKNFVDGAPEYWAFDNPFPTHGGGDPITLGEPCGYALFKASTAGRHDVTDEQVIADINRAIPVPAAPQANVCSVCGGSGLVGGLLPNGGGYDTQACPFCTPDAPQAVGERDRFFIEHDMIHDRLTGRHVHGDRSIDAGVADEAIFMLNELHASALREIKRYGQSEHVAWCRYVVAHDKPTRIVLCDSDADRAFKVFKSAASPASGNQETPRTDELIRRIEARPTGRGFHAPNYKGELSTLARQLERELSLCKHEHVKTYIDMRALQTEFYALRRAQEAGNQPTAAQEEQTPKMPEYAAIFKGAPEHSGLRVQGEYVTQHAYHTLWRYCKELSALRSHTEQKKPVSIADQHHDVISKRDTAYMNWLERQHVEVRTPLRYGSRSLFHASPDLEEETSDLRRKIARNAAAQK